MSVSLVAMGGMVSFAEGKVSESLSEVFDYEPEPIMDAILPAPTADVSPSDTLADEVRTNAGTLSRPYRASTPDIVADMRETNAELPPDEPYTAPSVDDETVNNTSVASDDTIEPYVSGGVGNNGRVYADISIEESRSFKGEEITADNSRTITVETSKSAINGADDSFTAYIRPNDGGYEMVRTE